MIEETTYYERTKEIAGIRRILHFAKEEIAKDMACKYAPEEDWTSNTCLHSYEEYMEELKYLQKQLRSFVAGETRQIVVRGIDAHLESYDEYMSHDEHETTADGRIVEFRYPCTRKQYEANEEYRRKEASWWFNRLIKSIDDKLNAKEGRTNAEIATAYKEEERQRNQHRSESISEEDNMPF